jgi:glutamate-1-semialdehyde aminotransferase/spore coat polysaccharide biosynthesis protein SpsF (cytidylyltransferase family)
MTLAIVQARMGSSRLPGKSMAEISGHPMLWHVINRTRLAHLVKQVVVATSEEPCDDPIADFCRAEEIPFFRGSHEDVLDRFYQAARSYEADTLVRITADCPLIDPEVVDAVIEKYEEGNFDYVSNALRYTYPDGLDTEVFSFAALQRAWQEARKPSEREHVTPYLRTSHFRTANVESDVPVPHGQYRWTVDEPADLEFIRKVFEAFPGTQFGYRDVLRILKEKADVAAAQGVSISNEGYYRSLYREAKAGAAPRLQLKQSKQMLERARKIIPGCAQTFSKSYTQYVQGVAPVFLQRGKGCRVWDVDGNEYIDYVQGLLPNILGYAHEETNLAATQQLARGHSFSLPHPLEIELAERLVRLIPCAEMVRFGKNGSDATSGAVRAARAFTGRDRIACCGYHGWQDWYIGSTTRHAGVPQAVRELTHSFRYNNLGSLQTLFEEYPGQFAAVIMEPMNFTEPQPGFLEGVKGLAHANGALLIFDEICSGFHLGIGGAQKLFGVPPDMACFGKAMGNGFPISCIVGRADVMKIFEDIFYSFTFAGEVASMAAAMKVLDILEDGHVLGNMDACGRRLEDGIHALAKAAGFEGRIYCSGRPTWSLMKFMNADGTDSAVLKNLFQQEAVKRGILFLATHNLTAAHNAESIHQTLEAYAEVFKTLSDWWQDPKPAHFLEGEMSQPVFKVR